MFFKRKMTILVMLAPFLISVAVIGKAIYNGPVGNVPSAKTIPAPLIPEPLPNHFCILFFGIHTSIIYFEGKAVTAIEVCCWSIGYIRNITT